jgi:hypothetical protein
MRRPKPGGRRSKYGWFKPVLVLGRRFHLSVIRTLCIASFQPQRDMIFAAPACGASLKMMARFDADACPPA